MNEKKKLTSHLELNDCVDAMQYYTNSHLDSVCSNENTTRKPSLFLFVYLNALLTFH